MLKTSEIISLEKRWKRYKIRQYAKPMLILLALLVPTGYFTLHSSFFQKTKMSAQYNKQEANRSNKDNNTKITPTVAANMKLEKYIQQNKKMQKEIQILKKDLKKSKQQSIMYANKEAIKQKFLEENSITEEFEKIEEKPRISIQSNDFEGLDALKKKFYQTKSIIFSLILAQEYYHQKKYKKSLKWALVSNEIDPENEKSWILFAKSKAKNGHSHQALKALRSYLKTHPNAREIKTLAIKIQKNTTKGMNK